MQSNVAIGLFTKLKKIYEKENKFLAFPMSGVAWTNKSVSFIDMDVKQPTAAAEYLSLAEGFAQATNFIAETATKLTYDDRNLWDVYKTVLHQRILPSSISSPADDQKKQQLRDFLLLPTVQREDGTIISKQDSYTLFQSDYHNAATQYNIEKITAESSSDQLVKNVWTAKEPGMKAKVDKALNDWVLKGFKNEVEDALAQLNDLGKKSPAKAWEDYEDKFNRQAITHVGAIGTVDSAFYLTSFYPADFYKPQSTQWQKFTLNENELNGLSKDAPDELKDLKSIIKIKSLSADIAYVDIRREWLSMEVFTATNWKLPPGEQPLSDGQPSASGRIPAIPVAILFARNVKFEVEVQTPADKTSPKGKTFINPAILANVGVMQLQTATSIPTVLPHLIKLQPQVFTAGTVASKPGVAATAATKTVIRPTVLANVAKMKFKEAAPTPVNLKRVQLTTAKVHSQVAFNAAVLKKVAVFKPANVNKDPVKPTQPPPEPQAELEVLAFVCQRLPLCPNPDPALSF